MNLHGDQDGGEKTFKHLFQLAIIVTGAVLLAALGAAILDIQNTGLGKPNWPTIGAIGDFIGGILNPLLAFLVLMVLLATTRLQKQELSQTREELIKATNAAELSNTENAFFQLFGMFNQNLQTIEMPRGQNVGDISSFPYRGSKAFQNMWSQVSQIISTQCSEYLANAPFSDHPDAAERGWNKIKSNYSNEEDAKLALLVDAYKEVYALERANLGRYFRLLYNLARFLKNKENVLPDNLYESYSGFIRASLTDYELIFILLNCLTEDGEKTRNYVKQFHLFDNLTRELLFVEFYDDYGNKKGRLDYSQILLSAQK